ncbi:MAG: NB-ARC domain-containing protein [Thermoguttaceae bacterium]
MDRVTGPTEPSRPTIKRLFAVSGNCCAFPGCDCPLVDQASGSVIGEVCHIKGEKPDSARYDKAQTPKERHAFENLILLCGRHHKIIDDNEGEHTVERLMGMKARHEAGHQGDSVNERASKRFIANVTSKGPVVVSQGQRGGQTAFQITNVYPVAPATPPAFEVPLPPRHFVPRPEEIQALKNLVLDSLNRPVAITGTAAIGLRGMGGIGKSVLAACLAREQEIEKAFPDGVFWIVIGQTPAIESLQAQLVAQLGRPGSRLRRVMADKTCLLVLDDVWTADHAEAFRGLGPSVRLLLTTRDASLINVLGSREYSLDRLRDEQAIDLLGKWSGESPEQIAQNPAAVAVARECGNLPLALAVCGAMRLGPEPLAWKEIQTALEEADLTSLSVEIPGGTNNTVLKSLHVGADFLRQSDPEAAERYLELVVFPEDVVVPEAAVAALWRQTGGSHQSENHSRKVFVVGCAFVVGLSCQYLYFSLSSVTLPNASTKPIF